MRYAVTAMICIQIGLALSVHLIDTLGTTGVVWLRLAWSALILLAIARPRRHHLTPTTVALGIVTGTLLLTFMAAAARLPLGTASAIEFLGPLTVAVLQGHGRSRWLWPPVAALGVLLLTRPWHGTDLTGVAFALTAAVAWAGYILLTQRAGDQATGLTPLAVSLPVALLLTTLLTPPATYRALTPELALTGALLAVIVTVIPFTLELLALRRLTTTAFGILMSLEPAIALLAGALLLAQTPGLLPLAGMALVVTAGIGAARAGRRPQNHTPPAVRPATLTPPAPSPSSPASHLDPRTRTRSP
ncbi:MULTISPECIES: EamA family transporter [Catenuloplanes]|uniref:Inner membrane transporter RhtA n=1 Tax=Catenuloplanes niger TaxID=587534 RepID=A0AAE4CX62_9ACTN|nr:EamA family transporter [Catenuloplanes niger]MDR7327910.1 inner membrane transporter RhtA [Catenuloplanes niger]